MPAWLYKEGQSASGITRTSADINGNVFTASQSGDFAARHIELTLINQHGVVQFRKSIAPPACAQLAGATCYNGSYFVVIDNADTVSGFWVIRLDGSGGVVWQKNYGNGGFFEQSTAIAVTSEYTDSLFVAGSIGAWTADAELFVTNIDGVTGAVLWDKTLPVGGTTSQARVDNLSVTDSAVYLVAGDTAEFGLYARLSFSTGAVDVYRRFTWAGMPASVPDDEHFFSIAAPRDTPTGCVIAYDGVVVAVSDAGSSAVYGYTTDSKISVSKDDYTGYLITETISDTEIRLRRVPEEVDGLATIEDKLTGVASLIGNAPGSYGAVSYGTFSNSRTPILTILPGGGVAPNYFGVPRILSLPANTLSAYADYDGYTYAAATKTTPSNLGAATLTTKSTTTSTIGYTVTTSALTVWSSVYPGTITLATQSATLAKNLPKMTSALTLQKGDGVDAVMPRIVGALDLLSLTVEANLAAGLPKLVAASKLTTAATAVVSLPKVTATLTADAVTAIGVVGRLPKPTGEVTAVLGGAGSITTDLHCTTATLAGGEQTNRMQLPAMRAEIEGYAAMQGTIAALLPKVASSFTGTATVAGAIASRLPRATAVLAAVQGNVASITSALRRITGVVTGATGGAASVQVRLPNATITIVGNPATYGTLNARLPEII